MTFCPDTDDATIGDDQAFIYQITNSLCWLRNKIKVFILWAHRKPFLATVKGQKLAWFGHVRRQDSFSKTILQGTLARGRRRGRQTKEMLDRQRQRVDSPAHVITVHNGLPSSPHPHPPPRKRLEEDLCWIIPHESPTIQ